MEQTTEGGVAGAITTLDLIVLAVYFLIVIVIGVWVTRKTKSGDDLFLDRKSTRLNSSHYS